MKKGTIISILIIALGFVFEYLYFMTDHTFLNIKFWVLGLVSFIVGFLGLWVTTILPFLNKKLDDNDSSS